MINDDITYKRRSDPGTYEAIFDANKDFHFLRKEASVLDVGCGTGSFLHEVKDLVGGRYGCDLNIEQYAETGNKQNIKSVNFDEQFLPYEDGSFDTVTILDVLEHVYNPMLIVKEAFRVIKEDGTIVISTPNVHNFVHRINFFFTGKLRSFWNPRHNREHGEVHVTPIFAQILEQFCKDKNYSIVTERYNRTIVPILRIHLKKKNRFLSETVVWVCKKKS